MRVIPSVVVPLITIEFDVTSTTSVSELVTVMSFESSHPNKSLNEILFASSSLFFSPFDRDVNAAVMFVLIKIPL